MILVSSGFKSAILGPQSFAQIFNGGMLRLFAGTRPESADAAEPTTPIATVARSDNTGLVFALAGQFVIRQPNDVWLLTALAAQTPTWFRLTAPGDVYTSASLTAPRIDGDVGTESGPSDMTLSVTLPFTVPGTFPFDSFLFTIPPVPGYSP